MRLQGFLRAFNTVGTFSSLPATHSGLSNKHVTSMKELLIFQVEW